MNNRSMKTTVLLGMALVMLGSLGCASLKTEGDPWTTHYVGDPDRVWTALHISLVELDYDVETENREEGTIHAIGTGDVEGASVVLSIDQMMVTNNVKVYVRVAAGAGEPAMSRDQQEKHAKDLLALVNGLLYK